MPREGQINAAGGFLKALGSRRGAAQAAGEEPAELPFTKVLAALAGVPGHEALNVDELAAKTSLSRVLLGEVLGNLSELGLVSLSRSEGAELVSLTETGQVVVAKQDEFHNT